MVSLSRYLCVVGLAVAVFATGCALGPEPAVSSEPGPSAALGASEGRSPSRAGGDRVDFAVAEVDQDQPGEIRLVSDSFIEAPLKAVASGFKSGADKVSEAFTLPVKKPDDPIALSTKAAPNADLYVAMAQLAEQTDAPDTAEQRYRQALQAEPNHLDALLGYAQLKVRQGKLDAAVELYHRAAEAHPKNATVHNALGLCLARRRQLDEAAAALARAVELDKQRPLYRNNLATVLVEMGNVDAARAQLAAVHPPAVACYNLGYLLQKTGQPQAAIAMFAQALELDPALQEASVWLGKLGAAFPAVPPTPQASTLDAGRLEDLSVEAPDLRASGQPRAMPVRPSPAGYRQPSPSLDAPRPIPAPDGRAVPKLTSPQAAASSRSAAGVRQLPPIYQAERRPGDVILQSWNDASPPATKRSPAPAAPLPDDAVRQAAPLP